MSIVRASFISFLGKQRSQIYSSSRPETHADNFYILSTVLFSSHLLLSLIFSKSSYAVHFRHLCTPCMLCRAQHIFLQATDSKRFSIALLCRYGFSFPLLRRSPDISFACRGLPQYHMGMKLSMLDFSIFEFTSPYWNVQYFPNFQWIKKYSYAFVNHQILQTSGMKIWPQADTILWQYILWINQVQIAPYYFQFYRHYSIFLLPQQTKRNFTNICPLLSSHLFDQTGMVKICMHRKSYWQLSIQQFWHVFGWQYLP